MAKTVLDATAHELIAPRLGDFHDLDVIESVKTLDEMLDAVSRLQPDALLLNARLLGNNPAATYAKINESDPKLHVVTLLIEADGQAKNDVIKGASIAAGYYTWLNGRLNLDAIHAAVMTPKTYDEVRGEHTVEVKAPVTQAMGPSKGQIMFLSPYTGGVGVSTLAVNTALALSVKHKVMLLDFNSQNPHAHLLLSERATVHALGKNIYKLQQEIGWENGHVPKELLEDHVFIVHEQVPGLLHFLPGAVGSPEDAQEVSGRLTQALFELFQADYDYIVIDGGRSIESEMVYYLLGKPELFLVTGQDYVQATDVKRVFLYLHEDLSLPKHRMHLIINGYDNSRSPKQNQIEAIAGMAAVTAIPYDIENVRKGAEAGQPIVAMKVEKMKHLRHAYLQLAEMIVEIGRESSKDPAIEFELVR